MGLSSGRRCQLRRAPRLPPSLDDTGAQQLFRVVAAACECRALGIASHWPFESAGAYSHEQI